MFNVRVGFIQLLALAGFAPLNCRQFVLVRNPGFCGILLFTHFHQMDINGSFRLKAVIKDISHKGSHLLHE